MEQKYNFAECIIQTMDYNIRTYVALKPMCELNIEEDDYVDEKVFFYFSNYEEFLEHLVKEPIFTDCDDFLIKAVLSLHTNI